MGSVCVCSHREFFDRILAVQGALLRIRVPNDKQITAVF